MDIKEILRQMSNSEKIDLLTGHSSWYTNGFDKYKIPCIRMSDGPYGLRIKNDNCPTLESTCFPPACTLANSFNDSLSFELGVALGEECQENKVNVLLGPGVNIKRSPLGGRNFEYFSEDPYLTQKLACQYINGIQSQGVGACLKHFCVNNQENYRLTSESGVDERALYEIYLKSFNDIIKFSQPDMLMASYNRFNGMKVTESSDLLIQKARNEFNFSGVIVSDWGANHDRKKSLLAGLDLEMPGDNSYSKQTLKEALEMKTIDTGAIDRSCSRILSLVEKLSSKEIKNYKFSRSEHSQLAKKISAEGAVLLKNKGAVLPLKKGENICFIGDMGQNMHYEGEGSSKVFSSKVIQPVSALKTYGIFPFEKGYILSQNTTNRKLEIQAIKLAERSDKIVFFAGFQPKKESEGYDKSDIKLPANQLHLIENLTELNKPFAVVLFNGSPVELPFADKVSSILTMYLPGQEGGLSCAQLLFGELNPSGHLAETWPLKLEDNPSYHYFEGRPDLVEYRESIYVGYRYYIKAKVPVRYPFGHGLSYTQFAYADFDAVKSKIGIDVSFSIKNVGPRAGAAVPQLYIGFSDTGVFKPKRELRKYTKVFLDKGEERKVSFRLNDSDFAYYNITKKKFVSETGTYTILIGQSAEDIVLKKRIKYESIDSPQSPYDTNRFQSYYNLTGNVFPDDEYTRLMGKKYSDKRTKRLPITMNSIFSDYRLTLLGKLIYRIFKKAYVSNVRHTASVEKKEYVIDNEEEYLKQFPNLTMNMICSVSTSLPYKKGEAITAIANGKFFSGLRRLIFEN